jgi:hypothetical protein
MEAQEISSRSTDWVLLVLLVIAFLVTAARLANAERVRHFIKFPFNFAALDWAGGFNPFITKKLSDLLISLSSLLTITLAIFFSIKFWSNQTPLPLGWLPYLRVLFLVTVVFLVKNMLGGLIAAVFEVQEQITAVQNINIAFFSWLLVPLYPLVVLTTFLDWHPELFSKALLGICATGALLALWQTARATFKISPVLSYNIFYLCALEISPVIFLILIFQNY